MASLRQAARPRRAAVSVRSSATSPLAPCRARTLVTVGKAATALRVVAVWVRWLEAYSVVEKTRVAAERMAEVAVEERESWSVV